MGKKKKQAEIKKAGSEDKKCRSDEYSALLLTGILFLALIVRAGALSSFTDSVYGDFLIWDEQTFHSWALKIVEGVRFDLADISPLPAYIMAGVYRLFSPDPAYIRGLNILLGVLTCIPMYLIGKSLGNKFTGLMSALVTALYKPFIFYSITIHKETLAGFLFAWAVWLLIAVFEKKSHYKMLLMGVAMGLLTNVRQNVIVLIPVFILIVAVVTFKREQSIRLVFAALAIYAVGVFLPLAPFMVKNYNETGRVSATAVGGFNLYFANNPENKSPYYRPVRFVSPVPGEQSAQFTIEASRRSGQKLTPAEASSYWTKEVFRIIHNEPAVLLKKMLTRTLALFNQFEENDNYDIGFISRFAGFFKLPFLGIWFILPLGMAGLIILTPGSGKTAALIIIAAIYAATMVAFFPNMRVRLPLLVILIPYAVIGLKKAYDYLKTGQRNRTAVYAVSVLLFAVVEFLPVEGVGDITAHYNTHAIVLAKKGYINEAVNYWKQASAMNKPYSAFSNLSLAGHSIRQKDLGTARSYLDKIDEGSFAAAFKHDLLGDVFLYDGKATDAVAEYRRSLDINSGQRMPRIKLINIYKKLDPKKAEEEERAMEYIMSFYSDRPEPDGKKPLPSKK